MNSFEATAHTKEIAPKDGWARHELTGETTYTINLDSSLSGDKELQSRIMAVYDRFNELVKK